MDRTPSVLIVEDNYLLLDVLTTLCEQHGVHVLAASSGEDAITALRRHGAAVDWLFTDINLPGLIDGWSVAAAYRSLHPGRPVIYASASGYAGGHAMGGGIFLRKPFKAGEIVELARMMARGEDAVPLRAAS